ncbi:barrier-to-autointegration factor B [Caerostris darwini]|uniref:Barrier-to-autointegration factor-like protein n=1 Tax=Caerostris darwini TaxID=1538125 RepID=A0AAV4TN08_9ARAC|nr:barrier-to-autointegration factor B [Caerostris darwini]
MQSRSIFCLATQDSKNVSQKYLDFVSSPMRDKGVETLPGMNPTLCKKLILKGYDKAYTVLGHFLLLKKQKELFLDWMKDICGASKSQASLCYQCLSDWCDMFA